MTAERWIDRSEVLERLGIKTQTLYAYVSRGRISARPDPANPRRSLYAAEDVARLSGSRAADGPAQVLRFETPVLRGEALIQSSLSLVAQDRLFYRGQDVAILSRTATLEDTARLLWDVGATNPFAGLGPRLDPAPGVTARGRLFSTLSRRAEEEAGLSLSGPEARRANAASVVNEVMDAVAGPGPRLYFHQRLGRGWKVLERDAALLRRALVLSADHGLDPAVLVVRAASGGGALPAAAALAGLATLVASPMLAEIAAATNWLVEARRDPVGATRRRREAGGDLPGFEPDGWPLGDPRAAALLDGAVLTNDLQSVLRTGEAAMGRPAGFALALALIARRLDLPRHGASDLFLLGRLVGLMGHALDQAQDGSPVAARLRYVGPRPDAD